MARIAIRVVVWLGLATLCWWFVRRLDGAQLVAAFRHAELWPLALGLAVPFLALWCKALCWRVMLWRVPTRSLVRYTIAAFAGSALAPARAGEALRVWLLKRRDGVPIAESAAVAVVEKLLDGVAMVIVMAPLPWLLPDLPAWVRHAVMIGSPVALAIVVGLVVMITRAPIMGDTWIRRFLRTIHVLGDPLDAIAALAPLIVAWLLDIVLVELTLHAFGIALPTAAALVVLVGVNLAIMVPTTPAQVGVHEAGALAGLAVFGVDPERALGFAVTYHALQVIPVVIAGLALEWRLVVGGARDDR
jgi:glycosyltransferase 2 family protein